MPNLQLFLSSRCPADVEVRHEVHSMRVYPGMLPLSRHTQKAQFRNPLLSDHVTRWLPSNREAIPRTNLFLIRLCLNCLNSPQKTIYPQSSNRQKFLKMFGVRLSLPLTLKNVQAQTKQGPIRHKPWQIQIFKDCHDGVMTKS